MLANEVLLSDFCTTSALQQTHLGRDDLAPNWFPSPSSVLAAFAFRLLNETDPLAQYFSPLPPSADGSDQLAL